MSNNSNSNSSASQTTIVVNKLHEACDIYIGRGSKWGNPFKIGHHDNREQVIAKYARYLSTRPELLAVLPELAGKRLGCFCKPQACHGDVLVELIHNPGPKPKGSYKSLK